MPRNIDDSNSSTSSSEGTEGDDDDYDDEDEDDMQQDYFPEKLKLSAQPIYSDKGKNKDEALHWGSLHPICDEYAGIQLYGKKVSLGQSAPGLLDNVAVEACLAYSSHNEANLEIISNNGFVYVNQRCIRKGEKVTLKERDQIGFYYAKTYVFTLFFEKVPQIRMIQDIKNEINDIPVYNVDKVFMKMPIPEMNERPYLIPVKNTLDCIFKKYGRKRLSECDKNETFLRKLTNEKTLKYLKKGHLEALDCICNIPFEHPEMMKFTTGITSLYRTLLLTIEKGGLKYLSRVVHYLADKYDIPMIEINYDNLGGRIDIKTGERLVFKPGDFVKYIGKGSKQKSNDDIELGTKGIVLFVKDNHVAVNFDVFGKPTATFVDMEYLSSIEEEVPETDQRIIGKLDEVIDRYGRKGEDGKGKMIVLVNNITSLSDNVISVDFRNYLRTFKCNDTNALLIGTMETQPPPVKVQSTQQVDQSFCMIGMKELRIETGPITKQSKDHQKEVTFASRLFMNVLKIDQLLLENTREWKNMITEDKREEQYIKNKEMILNSLSQLKLKIIDYAFEEMTESYTSEQIERAIGIAIQHGKERLYKIMKEKNQSNYELHTLTKEDIQFGLQTVREKKEIDIEAMETENEFEKRLLSDVIRSDDINVSFDDIGALDDVKEVLNETITLPLKRPELFFSKLTQGAKGVLLFGPPGTGKTMLAKAVATESKANFINVSFSSLGSKWFGEAEKYVKALFTLASKLSPCVVFVDEVDALLGKRTTTEHEAVRKVKNEFMSLWDGLKSKDMERVIVMAATNRPFDLDDAVLRRLSRRILVDLPNENNRVCILKKILRREKIDEDLDYQLIAQKTDGFSGSDLFALGQLVAMRPIKEYLANEHKKENEMKDGSSRKRKRDMNPVLRGLKTEDFLEELKKINPSVSKESGSLTELRRWNNLYGEGCKMHLSHLNYFL